MGEDLYKLLLAFPQTYKDALRSLNVQTVEIFADELKSELLKTASSRSKTLLPASHFMSLAAQESLELIKHSYKNIMRKYKIGQLVSESLASAFANLQVNTLFQLSQSPKTDMIHDLKSCFINAHYGTLADVINQALAKRVIPASDVAFLKTAELVQALRGELVFPQGLSTSIIDLNKSTAYAIVNNYQLEYNMINNRFISLEGEVSSKELNVICAGKDVLSYCESEILSEIELINFSSFLSQTPMLGSSNDTGKKIYELLKYLFNSGEKTIGFDKEIYFHCRSHKKNSMPFTFEQMLKAPNGLPWAGRYNQVGRSNYYFSDTRKGAEAEVKKHKMDNDILQTVRLKPNKEIKLLDLSGTLARGRTFLRYLRFSLNDATDKMPREYLIPCYVSDCCKALGFEGIKYYGAKEYSNYVAWNDGYFVFDGMC